MTTANKRTVQIQYTEAWWVDPVDSSDFWRKKRNKWPVFVVERTGRDKGHIQMSLIRIWFIFYLPTERGIHRPPALAMGVT